MKVYKQFNVPVGGVAKWSLRERIALFFIRPRISVDAATGFWIIYKMWRGRMYVLKEGRTE